MNIIKHKELKPRTEYKRTYDNKGNLREIHVSRSDIEELVSLSRIWSTIKWLNEKNAYLARFDITEAALATYIAKQVLTAEERKYVENELDAKLNSMLSQATYTCLADYLWEWYQNFKSQDYIRFMLAPYRVTYVKGNYRRSYQSTTISAKLTDKGKGFDI